MKEIRLTQEKVALVDDEDYDWLNQWKWSAHEIHRTWYAMRASLSWEPTKHMVSMHREILKAERGVEVDHWDGDGLNNQRDNLRICSRAENAANARKQRNASSKYKGVCVTEGKYITAYAYKDNKSYYLGRFKTEEEAAMAYNETAIKFHGEFARLNNIENPYGK
jgi:hypothetical protein